MREARWTSSPTKASPACSASPLWRPDPHADALVRRPGVGHQGALDRERGCSRRGGIVEDAEELVAAAVDLAAAGAFDGASLQLAGLGEHGGVAGAEAVGQPARVLDVAEEEGERHAFLPDRRGGCPSGREARPARASRARVSSRSSSSPSSASTRSRRPRRPEPRSASAPPMPSSEISTSTRAVEASRREPWPSRRGRA